MKPYILLLTLVICFFPLQGDTNSTPLVATPPSKPVPDKSNETLNVKITYDSQAGDIYIVSFNEGKNKIVMYGLPSNFAEGDSMVGVFYPAGTKIVGDKKYHAYAVSKELAQRTGANHAKRIEDLKAEIAKDKRGWDILDQLQIAEIKAYSSDYPDIDKLEQQKKELTAEIENDKKELAALKQD